MSATSQVCACVNFHNWLWRCSHWIWTAWLWHRSTGTRKNTGNQAPNLIRASGRLAVAVALARLFRPHRNSSNLLLRTSNQMSNKVFQILEKISKSHIAAQKGTPLVTYPGCGWSKQIFWKRQTTPAKSTNASTGQLPFSYICKPQSQALSTASFSSRECPCRVKR